MASKRFTIHSGELSDAPGRCESWVEYLIPLADDRWLVEVDGTTFSGSGDAGLIQEPFDSSAALAFWLQESDSLHGGERVDRVRGYAMCEQNDALVEALNNLKRSTRPSKPRVLFISGVTKVGAWPRGGEPRRTFLKIVTNQGPGIMAIPSTEVRTTTCWLGSHPYGTPTWKCPLRKELREQATAVLNPHSPDEFSIFGM